MSAPFTNAVQTLHHDVYPAIDPRGALKDSCAGKSVLITGAGRGIGKGIALAFALAGAARIIFTARAERELAEVREAVLVARADAPPEVIAQAVDVTSEASVAALFAALAARNIAVDVLVNNAGYLDSVVPIHETDPEEWWRTWEVNLKGTYLPTHFALKQRFAQRGAAEAATPELTIICTSSVGALMTMEGCSAYFPSKTAINRFAEFVHAEYGARGVRAFAYNPGSVSTQLAHNMPADLHHVLVDTAELAGGFCVWLATQRAADRFAGRYVSVNWDVDEMKALEVPEEDAGRWLMTKVVM